MKIDHDKLAYIQFPKDLVPFLRFSFEGERKRLVFRSNDLWYIEIPQQFCSWISVSQDEGNIGSQMISVETSPYDGDVLREGYIFLICWDEKIQIPVVQYSEYVPIKDIEFEAFLLEEFGFDGDCSLPQKKANEITCICIPDFTPIHSLSGIEYMPNLEKILLYDRCPLAYVDLRYNDKLTEFNCQDGHFDHLDLSHNPALVSLAISSSKLGHLDITHNKALKEIGCWECGLSELDLSCNTLLEVLDCSENSLTNLDVSHNTDLYFLRCGGNQLTSLDVSQNTMLETLDCADNNLQSLDVTHNTLLEYLDCGDNILTDLDVTNNKKLRTLLCCRSSDSSGNNLFNLDLSKNISLERLNLTNNKLSTLDISNNSKLYNLEVEMSSLQTLFVGADFDPKSISIFSKSYNTQINYIDSERSKYLYLFVDTETTGLPLNYDAPSSDIANWPRLVQLSWILTDGSRHVIAEHDYIIKPNGFIIPKDASDVHGITTEKACKNGVDIKDVLNNFLKDFNACDNIVGHNISFDKKIIGAELLRLAKEDIMDDKCPYCTMVFSTNFCAIPGYKGFKYPKLQELHQKLFGFNFDNAHNSLADVRATMRCFWELVDREIIIDSTLLW